MKIAIGSREHIIEQKLVMEEAEVFDRIVGAELERLRDKLKEQRDIRRRNTLIKNKRDRENAQKELVTA